jgi:hypothetical protein
MIDLRRSLWLLRGVVVLPAAWVLVFMASGELTNKAMGYNNSFVPSCGFQYSGGSDFLTVPWKYYPDAPYAPYGDYLTAFSDARGDWNGTQTPVWFPLSPGTGNHTLSVRDMGNFPGVALGATNIISCSGGFRQATDVALNWQRLDFWDDPDLTLSVAQHELGHHIGIGHSAFWPSVMVAGIDPQNYVHISGDDICGVNHRYPSTQWPLKCLSFKNLATHQAGFSRCIDAAGAQRNRAPSFSGTAMTRTTSG